MTCDGARPKPSWLTKKSINKSSCSDPNHPTETMKLKYLRLAALALAIPNVLASNLRESKSTKEWRLFNPKVGKQSYAAPSAAKATSGYDSKAGKNYGSKSIDTKATRRPVGKSTNNDSSCGAFWHRSLNPLNLDSCTNDNNLPNNSAKLYSIVEGVFKAFTRSSSTTLLFVPY